MDQRYLAARHGDLPHQMPVYDNLTRWQSRANWLRQHLLAVQGLWPVPERTPLKPQVTNEIVHDDYTIQAVHFESWPGFYCTGNLYRPRGKPGPFPAILNPHGHWEHGRLEHQPRGSIRARCITFARMGMVALAIDMVGMNDSLQVPQHHFATLRGALWGLTPLALQTWNSIRAIDYLTSLPDVDPERIGCTGASGGATQTLLLAAADERVKVLAPVNMISAHFQGGCRCENLPGLRTQTFNVEIGALAAPRPMLMVSATGDWTVNTPKVEYPAIRHIYQLYGFDERLAWAQVDAEHNYNAESREHVYRWFARWFLGQEPESPIEQSFLVDADEQMRVFATNTLPAGAHDRRQIEQGFCQRAQDRLAALRPSDETSLARLREIVRRQLEQVLEACPPELDEVCAKAGAWEVMAGLQAQQLVLGRREQGDRILATAWRTHGTDPDRWLLAVHAAGREGLLDAFGAPGPWLRATLDQGWGALCIDAFDTGAVYRETRPGRETSSPETITQAPRHDHDWFWLTFNPALLGQRVQDILTSLAYLKSQNTNKTVLLAPGDAGAWGVFASALSPHVDALAADLAPESDDTYLGQLFAPALCAYGGQTAALALLAPRKAWLGNTQDDNVLALAQAAYGATHSSANLSSGNSKLQHTELPTWLAQL